MGTTRPSQPTPPCPQIQPSQPTLPSPPAPHSQPDPTGELEGVRGAGLMKTLSSFDHWVQKEGGGSKILIYYKKKDLIKKIEPRSR